MQTFYIPRILAVIFQYWFQNCCLAFLFMFRLDIIQFVFQQIVSVFFLLSRNIYNALRIKIEFIQITNYSRDILLSSNNVRKLKTLKYNTAEESLNLHHDYIILNFIINIERKFY